jgi:hypothetical protein
VKVGEKDKLGRNVAVRLPRDVFERVLEVVERKESTLSKFVRAAILAKLEQEEVAAELEKMGYPRGKIDNRLPQAGINHNPQMVAQLFAFMFNTEAELRRLKKK